jgi:hypothetical protein
MTNVISNSLHRLGNGLPNLIRPEFDWIKLMALFLLILSHSALADVYPEAIESIMWFFLSGFFFISGFLALDSFYKHGASIRQFFKSKFWSLYIPFFGACIFYFVLETILGGMQFDAVRLSYRFVFLNVFDAVNSQPLYNWSILWFIPCLLIFMFIFCLLEKYVKNIKFQVLIVSSIWILSILAWVFNSPFKLGMEFSEYLLVFTVGFWINKLKVYEKVMNLKTASLIVPSFALFSFDLSYVFNWSTPLESFKSLLYFNGRIFVLGICAVFMVLLILRKITIPGNNYVRLIASASIFVYLTEPFFSYLLTTYVFGVPMVNLGTGTFYVYQTLRIGLLLVLLPVAVKLLRDFYKKHRISHPKPPTLTAKSSLNV